MSHTTSPDRGKHEAWYARFFKRDYLQFYGRTLNAERTDHETQFAIRTLSLEPGHSVLDLCCGQGRHSIALANTGINVTSVDLSEEMLAIARETSQHMATPPDFIQADMRNLPQTLNGKFDAAINMFSSFGYLESESDDQAVLHQVANALKPGGQMMMDLLNREWVIRYNEPFEWQFKDDGTIILEHRELDLRASINHLTFTEVVPDGSRSTPSELHMRLYTLTEMDKMLATANLQLTSVAGGFNGEDYSVDTRRMILVARKPS